MASVEEEIETVEAEISVPRRGQNTRSRSPKKPKKKINTKEQSQQEAIVQAGQHISQMIVAVTGVLSLRLGDHWAISQQEADAISAPASRIMSRHDIIEKVNTYGDYSALLIALGVAVVPRIMAHQQISKQRGVRIEQAKQPTTGNGQTNVSNDERSDYELVANSTNSDGRTANAKDFLTSAIPIGTY